MSKTMAAALMAASSVIVLAAAPSVRAQSADQPAAAESNGLDEVVVTARRREERAQAVPIVVDTFTQQALTQRDIHTIEAFAQDVPGLTFCCGAGRANSVWLRGVPGVVAYFADAPLGVFIGAGTSGGLSGSAAFYDMENIQVLKGPQGTLFGVNADGGALLFEPKKPGNDFEGYAQLTLGDYNRHTIEGAASIPVVKDKLLLRVGGIYSHTDGYIHDLNEDRYVNDDDFWVGRGSLIARPTDDIENYTVFNYFYSRTANDPNILVAVNPAGPAARIFGAKLSGYLAQQQSLGFYTFPGSGTPGGTSYRQEQINLVNTTRWDVSDTVSVKNILGYSEYYFYNQQELDGTPLPIADPYTAIKGADILGPLSQYSEELQAQGKAFGEKLDWTTGGYLSFYHLNGAPQLFNTYLGATSGTNNYYSGRTQALYAEGTYDLSSFVEGLKFTGGYRYNWDWRSGAQNNLNAAGAVVGCFAADASYHAPGYRLSLAYQIVPDTMVYVTDSKAYSSGGFNLTAAPQFKVYQPEYLNNVEVGVKSEWSLGGIKVRTNADWFYGMYQNIQVAVSQAVTNPNGTKALTTVISNAANAHITGIEFDGTILPFTGLELTGNFLWMQAKYDQYITAGIDQASTTPFLNLPKMKYSVHGRYHLPVDAALGDISLAASYTWQQHLLSGYDPTPFAMTPSFGTLDLNLDWDNIAGRPFDASLFVTNLAENHTIVGQTGAYATSSFGFYSVAVAPPRMFGVRLAYRFGPGQAPAF
jgi:iron complex outermembrane receptor protein